MNLSFEIYLVIAMLLLYADIIIVLKVILNRLKAVGRKEELLKDKKEFINDWSSLKQIGKFSETYKQVKESIDLDPTKNEEIEGLFDMSKAERKSIKELNSLFKLTRME